MDPAQQRATLFAKLDSLIPPSTRTPLQHGLIMASNNASNIPSTPPEIQSPPAYHMVVDPNAPIPNMNNPYHPLDDMDDGLNFDEVDEEAEESSEDDEGTELTINAQTDIIGHGNIIGFEPMDAKKVALLVWELMGKPQPGAEGAQPTVYAAGNADRAVLNVPGQNMRITINCGTTVRGNKNILGPGLAELARTMAIARSRQAGNAPPQTPAQAEGAPSPQQATQGASPPASGSTSGVEGAGSGGLKRKAEDEEVEGAPEAKKAELSP
ncbi:hypothetical protein BDV96DRAFT_595280 [Lophiotrema nucula]|uniref:Uncharacterized protein n=1 Tax=Lophiotrema nucula TaxID=690887 RepID=A0A6A5ZNV7_9PLEO|nr:hypothetical protein BDV96DRAFT_595280 [Lophiotrema nucula]